jgi:transcriptional regulator GlxA family with amidase domain
MSQTKPISRLTVMVAFPRAQVLDITGPMQMFSGANGEAGARRYELVLTAEDNAPIKTNGGLKLMPDRTFGDFTAGDFKRIDTLLISGGDGTAAAMGNSALLSFCRKAAKHARRVASICTGALILAELGLLDGKRATTHWESLSKMQARYPRVDVDEDAPARGRRRR